MKLTVVLSLLLLAFISCDNYGVLVAGSNTWPNYRHQADVYHAYQILKARGMKPENIIVFDYDDIANNARNPFPGKVFNSPAGIDVYEGVVIDYFGVDVTPENFVAAMIGDADSVTKKDSRTTGKVLTSTENDNIFVFFSGHGSDNLIAFPSKYLYADELNDALMTMNEKKMYKQLVFYLEAKSIFEKYLPTNIKIYTLAIDNSHGSSGDYCGSYAKVNGTTIGTCLADEFSRKYMEDIDSRPGDLLKHYTLQEQYEYLVKAVTNTQVAQYGDLEVAQKSIFNFVSGETKKFLNFFKNMVDIILPKINEETTKIKNENYRLEWFKMQAKQLNNMEAENEYYEEVAQEGRTTKIFEIFKNEFKLPERNYNDEVNFDCYRTVVNAYEQKCGMLIDRDFKFMTHIANFCTQGINLEKAVDAFATICE